jgi:hypothetical protein
MSDGHKRVGPSFRGVGPTFKCHDKVFSEKTLILQQFVKASLARGETGLAVQKPDDTVIDEWLAINSALWGTACFLLNCMHQLHIPPLAAVDFFGEISQLFGLVSEFCSETSCPTMSAGPRFEYLWADSTTTKVGFTITVLYFRRLHWIRRLLLSAA